MGALSNAVAEILSAYEALGLSATSDPRSLNPPGLLLAAPTIRPRFGKNCIDVDWRAYLVAINSGQPGSLDTLSDLVDTVLKARPYAITACYPFDLALPGGGDAVPSYQIEWVSTHPL